MLFDTYTVTKLLHKGENALAVELGNGWYNPLPMRMWGRFNPREELTVGCPCLIAKLDITYVDGARETMVSDASWKVSEGPALRNSL